MPSRSSATPSPLRFALLAFGLLLALTAANLIFNLVAIRAGWPTPYRSVLPPPGDRFADFFKLAFSYPGGHDVAISDMLGLGDILRAHQRDELTRAGVEALRTGAPNHFHLTPLSTLIALLNVRAMQVVDPALLFAAWMAGFALWWASRARSAATGRTAALVWIAFGLLSYPMLFMVERGNVFAAIVGLALVHALLLAFAGRGPLLAGLLLALAVNIRPNAVMLAAPMVLMLWPWRYRFTVALVLGTLAIALPAFAAAHALYQDYTPANFLAGLRTYVAFYIAGGRGLAYNSSLYGALALLFGPDPLLDRLALLASGGLLAIALLLFWLGRLDRFGLLFVSCAAYCLASTIFADYHLIVFLAVPLALAGRPARAGRMPGRSEWPAFLAAIAMLVPKHYAFGGSSEINYWISIQSVLNPVILCAATLLLLSRALRAAPGRTLH